MSSGDIFWHLCNFFVVAIALGLVAALSARLIWRREMARSSGRGLALLCVGAAAGVQVLGLVVLGSDGRMATYAAMVLAVALTLWWAARRR